MVRVATLNLKHSKKLLHFFILIIIFAICICFLKRISSYTILAICKTYFLSYSCLDTTIPGMSFDNSKSNNNFSLVDNVLVHELSLIDTKYLLPQDEHTPSSSLQNESQEKAISYAPDNVTSEVIQNNVPTSFTDDYQGVEVKNGTDYELTYDILNPDNIDINKNDVIIFHTHTCESYTQSDNYQYDESGTFRTIDLERSVVKVGSELSTYLTSYGFNVTHDTTYHDYPSYEGSYGRSMSTVESILSSKPNTDIILDIHRDAIADTTYAPSVKIGDEIVSQLMFVIGTDGRRYGSSKLAK